MANESAVGGGEPMFASRVPGHTHTITTDNVVGAFSHYASNTWQVNAPYPPNYSVGSTVGSTFIPMPPPMPPQEGTVGVIAGVPHRYEGGIWIQIEPSDETVGAPEIRLVLDASAMLNALRAYCDFLDDVHDGLDKATWNVVDDTLFGLREAIEALEKIGLKQN